MLKSFVHRNQDHLQRAGRTFMFLMLICSFVPSFDHWTSVITFALTLMSGQALRYLQLF